MKNTTTWDVSLGDLVVDALTGFEGIVTGRTEYITGCRQILVRPAKLDDKGKSADADWYDEDRLEIKKSGAFALPRRTANGPDLQAPIR